MIKSHFQRKLLRTYPPASAWSKLGDYRAGPPLSWRSTGSDASLPAEILRGIPAPRIADSPCCHIPFASANRNGLVYHCRNQSGGLRRQQAAGVPNRLNAPLRGAFGGAHRLRLLQSRCLSTEEEQSCRQIHFAPRRFKTVPAATPAGAAFEPCHRTRLAAGSAASVSHTTNDGEWLHGRGAAG